MTASASASQFWFMDSLVTVLVAAADSADGISVLEHSQPHGASAPLHLHRTEDEIFQVLEGEYRVQVNGREQRLHAGDVLLAPKGLPHTYRVESVPDGRCLTITARGDLSASCGR